MDVEYQERMSELRDHFNARERLSSLLKEGLDITESYGSPVAIPALKEWREKVRRTLESEGIDRGG